ncbi:MAG: PP0621 family protein [Aquabacterium sp.]|nr:PP0621 family protein [Aquabacterium sp.]
MLKYLLLALVVVWLLYSPALRGRINAQRKTPKPPQQQPSKPQDMVQCTTCGVHLPALEATIGSNGKPYCCLEHKQADHA